MKFILPQRRPLSRSRSQFISKRWNTTTKRISTSDRIKLCNRNSIAKLLTGFLSLKAWSSLPGHVIFVSLVYPDTQLSSVHCPVAAQVSQLGPQALSDIHIIDVNVWVIIQTALSRSSVY